jgi:hypothetical protein
LGGDGVTTPTTRTLEQTEIGLFWGYDGSPGLGVPPRLYNQIAVIICNQMGNTEVQNARLLALVNIAMADAGITVWDTKYVYNFWRPVAAIREADTDGNPNTIADPNWRPLGAPADNHSGTNFTPPFPAYTSGHAGFGASLFRTLADFYGTDDVTFTIGSDEFNGMTADQSGKNRPIIFRTFDSFSAAAEENGQSRIYLGIHWRFDKEQGILQGGEVADYVFSHVLLPRSPSTNGILVSLPAPAKFSAVTNSAGGVNLQSPDLGIRQEAVVAPTQQVAQNVLSTIRGSKPAKLPNSSALVDQLFSAL